MECDNFINKIKQLPERVKREAALNIFGTYIVPTKNIIDFLVVTYNLLPEDLRNSRKKGQRLQYKTFKYFDKLDKIFMGKGLFNTLGFNFVKMKEIETIIKEIVSNIPSDENKMIALRQ